MGKGNKLKVAITILLIVLTQRVFAQNIDVAYWVTEGNIQEPTYTIIYYYDQHHQLIKKERIEGKYLNISKRRTVKYLNKKLKVLINSKLKVKTKDKSSFPASSQRH